MPSKLSVAASASATTSPDSSYLVAKILKDQNKTEPAKQLLKAALETESPGIFIYRRDAQEAYDKLNKP